MVIRGHVHNGVVVLDEDVKLPEGQQVVVHTANAPSAERHSLLDIPPVSMGKMLRALGPDDDLLEEMLEGRKL
jgi:hypothetical protein